MVKLFGNWYLDGYTYGLTAKEIKRTKNKETGEMEEVIAQQLYYNTVEGALKDLRKREIWKLAQSKDTMLLGDFYKRLIKLNKKFEDLIDTTTIEDVKGD